MTIGDRFDEREETNVEAVGDRIREVKYHEDAVEQQREATSKVVNLIILMDWAVQILIGLRVFLKAIAANPGSPFANFIYSFSELFVWPFNGLAMTPSAEGFVFDLPAVIAMIVYALAGWLIARFIWIIFNRRHTNRISTYERD